jgi:general secretion pathway protein G
MSCKRTHRPRPAAWTAGFSLVEIMIVIVIIGLLAGVVTVNVRSYLLKAKQNVARQDIAVIVSALDRFWADNGRYPTNDEGLAALCVKSAKHPEPLLAREPVDPWGRAYVYICPGSKGPYEVLCKGPDNRDSGEGVISSDDLPPKATP